ncbi:MAG: hypothetical protein C3F13_00255 [Anaerolineales bacterium]|nr:hypothetical protein [Anaerolineae bacterium]PWB56891.1 MAG: hypothetical protein C3F13_00255 [Anaerolineales bacterium]
MKTRILKIIWGVVCLFLAGLTLACLEGYVPFDCFSGKLSVVIFACLSGVSFLSYFLSGTRYWAWLFPALISASLALNAAGLFMNYGSPIVAFPILISLAIPCYVGYFLNRTQWAWLVPAWLLTIIAFAPPLSGLVEENLLIALIVYSISLPFMVGCLTAPECRWSLFVAAFFGFLGVFYLVESFIHGAVWGPALMLGIGLVFIAIAYRSKKNWWASILAGIFTTIGMVALLNRLIPGYDYISIGEYQLGIYSALLFLGFALTFGLVWRLGGDHRHAWAKYPALGFLVLALIAFLVGQSFIPLLPAITFFVIGMVMVTGAILKAKFTRQISP